MPDLTREQIIENARCDIHRVTLGAMDPLTLEIPEVRTAVAENVECYVHPRSAATPGTFRAFEAIAISALNARIRLPKSVGVLRNGDEITVIDCDINPSMVGKVFTVLAIETSSYQTTKMVHCRLIRRTDGG